MKLDPQKFSNKTSAALAEAQKLASQHGHIEMTPLHLAIAIFSDEQGLGRTLVKKLGVDPQALERVLRRRLLKLPTQSPAPDTPPPSGGLIKLLETAADVQNDSKDSHLSIDHVLLALVKQKDPAVSDALAEAAVAPKNLEDAIKDLRAKKAGPTTTAFAEETYEALSKYGTDLVQAALDGKLDKITGRHKEMQRTIQILSRRTKNNAVLVGPAGVGKTACVEGIAQRIANGDVPESLKGRRIWSLDVASVVAGAQYRGQAEERLKSIIDEVTAAEGKIILFIDEMHLLVGAGKGDGALDFSQQLKPALARGQLRCIGATTLEEYKKYIEKDAALERRFQPVMVEEPSMEETISILRGLKEKMESHHGVHIADAALVAAAQLSTRYISGRFQPDKSVDLVDEACAAVRVQLDSQPEIIDNLQRKKMQLEIEATALLKEKDSASQARLQSVYSQISALDEELKPLQLIYEQERERVMQIRQLRAKLDDLQTKIQSAERRYDLAMVADLKYGAVPELEARLRGLQEEEEEAERSRGTRGALLRETVAPEQIAGVISRWTGIPVSTLNQSERERLLGLRDRLKQVVIGQDAAVNAIADAVLRNRAGLGAPNRPWGSFLFCGPTGSGKTLLCKELARELFDDPNHMTRIDMSEYMEGLEHSVSRLIGAPPGFIGHDEGGQLTESVRRRGYQVVLFDEVEKAGRKVFDVLLQLLDDGRLTDGKGRTVDFSNTVIVMTSNLGSEYILDYLATLRTASSSMSTAAPTATATEIPDKHLELPVEVRSRVMDAIRRHFRPEFLNRLDDIVLFDPLSRDNLYDIIKLQIAEVGKRLKSRHISVQLDKNAMDFLLAEAYDPVYGARPLRRYIDKHIITELSRLIIAGDLPDHSIVQISVDPNNMSGGFHYHVVPETASPSTSRTSSGGSGGVEHVVADMFQSEASRASESKKAGASKTSGTGLAGSKRPFAGSMSHRQQRDNDRSGPVGSANDMEDE